MEVFCHQCHIKKKRKNIFRKTLLIGLVISALALAAFWINKHGMPFQYKSLFQYGKYKQEIRDLEQYLEGESCDRPKSIKYVELLFKAGDYREAINKTNSINAKCGINDRLLWVSYSAHKKLSEYESAITVVSQIIANDKYDMDYWWWRGELYELTGKNSLAINDYRQAISLYPKMNSIPFKLSDLLEKEGKPCEAIFPIEQFVFFNPKHRDDIDVTERLSHLYSKDCAYVKGNDKAIIRFSSKSAGIRVTTQFNQKITGRFIFDTGASYVTISESFSLLLGIDLSTARTILVQTAGGIRTAKLAVVDEIELQGLQAKHVEIAIMKDGLIGDKQDGLLGLSFISRFNYTIDNNKHIITIEKKSAL